MESQKMIYAPPSREKSKQTMRSPVMDKGESEYLMGSTVYSGVGTIGGQNVHSQISINGKRKQVIP